MINLANEKAKLMEEVEILRRAEGNEGSHELEMLRGQVSSSSSCVGFDTSLAAGGAKRQDRGAGRPAGGGEEQGDA
eukprot:766939-Hanusia_phi.AAC.7